MIGLLAGPLNGAAFGADVPDFASGSSGFGVNSGQFVVAIDIGRFTSAERFHDQLRHHIQSIESAPRMAGATAVRWPGQARERRSAAAHQEGIAVSAPLLDALDGIAKTWGVLALERRK
jgi:LDH2 family malate/lactate/ureidoglycolate dehydrogenase